MAKTLEQLADEIYNEALEDGEEVSREEALEMAQMEMGAKEIKNYTQAEVEKKPKTKREVKLDDEKVAFIKTLKEVIEQNIEVDALTIANPQKEITFKLGGSDYSISLIKHRPKKVK